MVKELFIVAFVFVVMPAWAQKNVTLHAEHIGQVVIDGDLTEWGGKFLPVSADKDFSYQVRQDEQNVYIAFLIQNNLLQSMATLEGISIVLQAKEKGQKDAMFWFPYADDEVRRALMNEDRDRKNPTALKNALILRSRGYYVYGFSGVPDGLLGKVNSYGLVANGKVTDSPSVTYEVVIPKERWVFADLPVNMKLEIHADRSALLARRSAGNRRKTTAPIRKSRGKKSKDEPVNKVLLSVEL